MSKEIICIEKHYSFEVDLEEEGYDNAEDLIEDIKEFGYEKYSENPSKYNFDLDSFDVYKW